MTLSPDVGTITLAELLTLGCSDFPGLTVGELKARTVSWPTRYDEDSWEPEWWEMELDELIESILERGLLQPLELWTRPWPTKDDEPVACLRNGHHRAMALKQMDYPHPIPVVWWSSGEEER